MIISSKNHHFYDCTGDNRGNRSLLALSHIDDAVQFTNVIRFESLLIIIDLGNMKGKGPT